MKSFEEFTGLEGIDVLMDIAPSVGEIISDKEIFENTKTETAWIEVGARVYKAHKDACDKLLKAVECEPKTSFEIMSSVAKVLKELFGNGELMAFFISVSGVRQSLTSATETSEGAQSKAS